jgi:uncharacterized protein
MHVQNNRGARIKRFSDGLLDHGRPLALVVICGTLLMALFVPGVERDPSLKSILVTSSDAYLAYQQFTETFGKDDFLVVMIKSPLGANDPRALSGLRAVTDTLKDMDKIAEVVSLSTVKMLQKRGKRLGNYPILRSENGAIQLPDPTDLEKMRKAVPLLDLMISQDLTTLGILVRIQDQWRFDGESVHTILRTIEATIKRDFPPGSDHRVVGTPVLAQAIVKYSDRTAVIFGILCTLICTGVTLYVFRTLTVSAVTMLTLGMSVVWVLGLMAVLKIPLNAATSMSFGLILITNLEVVIHVVARYRQFHSWGNDRVTAVKEAVGYLGRPILICSTTTAVGFGSCMVTSIPMVFEFGLIMSLGIILSFCLLMVVTPNLVAASTAFDTQPRTNPSTDTLSRVLIRVEKSISGHHRLYTIGGLVMAVAMFAGAPFVRTDPQLLRQLDAYTREVKDIAFVSKHLTSVHYLQLVLTAEPAAFKQPEIWTKVAELEERLKHIPEVVTTESLLSFLSYVHSVTEGKDTGEQDLFSSPGLLPQLLFVASLNQDGKRMCRQYLDEGYERLRIAVRIKNSPSVPVGDTIDHIRAAAESVIGQSGRVTVTGEMAVIAENGANLIESEIYSMFIAGGIIAMLMILQMGSVVFGLICLIPSIPPVAAVFGIMGWFGIALDGVTIFAATVATGLAVDNTIHYVAQLKREMQLNPELGVEACVFRAYRLAAKPMASWAAVTVLGFLAMLASPFKAANNFGILVAAAVFMGMFGDLILMQSMILTFPRLKTLVSRLIKSETSEIP